MTQGHTHCSLKCLLRMCVLALSLLANLLVISPPVHANASQHCDSHVLPVTLSVLDPTVYHVVGWLCYNGSLSQYSMVQVLVHGATYGHLYWDFPYWSADYSYVQYMAKAGYATFNFDRIGIGGSDHPSPSLITIQANAYVLSQLISDLKTGAYGGPAFQKVVLVGHSVGSAISIAEAADTQETHADGIILTGFLHFVDPIELNTLANDIYPANMDPDPRFHSLPSGYLTTKPGTRGQLFYYLPKADAQVMNIDEQTKETITESEFTTFFAIANSKLSQRIQVPVLVVVGQDDNIFCLGTFSCTNSSNVQQYEAAYYALQAHLQLLVIPQAGHDLNLQKNASTAWYLQAVRWMQTNL